MKKEMFMDNASGVKITACVQYIVLDNQQLSVLDNEMSLLTSVQKYKFLLESFCTVGT